MTRAATMLGLSIAVLGLWASPAFAHDGRTGGDWHHGDRGSFSGVSDPTHTCDHGGTSGTSDEQKAAATSAPKTDADADTTEAEGSEPESEVADAAPAAAVPEVATVLIRSTHMDTFDPSTMRASASSSNVPVAAWVLGFVMLFGGASAALRYRIVRR